MRHLFKRGLLALALVFSSLIGGLGASPAQAGDNSWTFSSCRSDVSWYGVPGVGSWIFTAADQNPTGGTYHWLDGPWYQVFAAHGYECGDLGRPIGGVLVADYPGQNYRSGLSAGHSCGSRCSVTVSQHLHFEFGCIYAPTSIGGGTVRWTDWGATVGQNCDNRNLAPKAMHSPYQLSPPL